MPGPRSTYMLLPNFSYTPSQIPLGSLLQQTDSLPDPEDPILDSPLPIPSSKIRTQTEHPIAEPWKATTAATTNLSAGIFAELPILSNISASLGFDTSTSRELVLTAEKIETSWFVPDKKQIFEALNHRHVLVGHSLNPFRAPVYLVTGVKVAYKVGIEFGGKQDGKVSAGVGGGDGAVVRVGPKVEVGRGGSQGLKTELEGPLVLAYQLKKIRATVTGQRKMTGYDKHAFLWSDEKEEDEAMNEEKVLEMFDELWEAEDVGLEQEDGERAEA